MKRSYCRPLRPNARVAACWLVLASFFSAHAESQIAPPVGPRVSGKLGSLTAAKISLVADKKSTQYALAAGVVVTLDGVSVKVGELKVGDQISILLREEKGKQVVYKLDAHRLRKKSKD